MRFFRLALAILVAAAMASAAAARAEDFYAGKTLTIVVGFSPGGGFDLNARMLARHIGKHIPGNPDVVVVNQPGAASSLAVLRLDTTAPKDGTVVNDFNFGLIGDSLLQPDKTRIDFRNYAWIGSISEDLTVCYLWRAIGPNSIAAMKAWSPGFHFGTTGFGTSDDLNTKILKNIFGVKIQQVGGYPGSAELRLAIERGELDGDCGAWASLPEEWIKAGKISPVSRSGRSQPPDMPADVPVTEDIAPDAHARQIIHLLLADGRLGRPFIASKVVPADRVNILRAAFDATMKDPAFLEEAKKADLEVRPATGDEIGALVTELYDAPPEALKLARDAIKEQK
jgi:tripartite-type tricarboxylate transporter receptor subunit TctC